MQLTHRPNVLIVLDGWGYRQEKEDNAIAQANTPHWNHIWSHYPHTLISGSGADVGLPDGQMGNSEVGHLNLGAGRMVPQELGRINLAIKSGEFFNNAVLTTAADQAIQHNRAIHILGLLSAGGVHSHEEHIYAMAELAVNRGASNVYIHAFLDGRDTPPRSALPSLLALQNKLTALGHSHIASLCGRYYAMDRDKRWDRVQQAYDLLTLGQASYTATNAAEGLEMAYARNETDEFVQATAIHGTTQAPIKIEEGDVLFFMNFRADRTRQLSHAFVDTDFTGFPRAATPKLAAFVTLTEYEKDLPAQVAYPPQTHTNTLGEYIANLGLKQLRIAETEKYAHVTFFFNGGIEHAFASEDRQLIPSPKVATYDLQPEMSAFELTDALIKAIDSEQYDLIIANYANADMVGHTGQMSATIKAIEALDTCLGKVVSALQSVGGEAFITADHGNAEVMCDHETGQAHTAHTSQPVPLVYIGRPAQFTLDNGTLCDVAPTLLHTMGLAQPKEMTGHNLIKLL